MAGDKMFAIGRTPAATRKRLAEMEAQDPTKDFRVRRRLETGASAPGNSGVARRLHPKGRRLLRHLERLQTWKWVSDMNTWLLLTRTNELILLLSVLDETETVI